MKKYPSIKVLASQPADNQRAKGLQVMENLAQSFASIDAVMCGNDEMALGAVEALDAAKRLGKIMVSGFDANDDALKAVFDGRMMVTMDQNPQKQAADAVQAIVDYLAGKKVPSRIVTPGVVVTKDNIGLYSGRIKK